MDIKPLAVKRDAFGGACVTSLGMLDIRGKIKIKFKFSDAFVPFTPFMNCPVIMAVG